MSRTNFRRRFLAPALYLGGILALACCTTDSALQTQMADKANASTEAQVGLHYFLPRGKIRMVGTIEKDSDLKITSTRVIEPDRDQLCFVRYQRSYFHDDDFTLEVDDSGLLKTVNSTSTDQTPAIVESLTETAVSLLKLGSGMPASTQGTKQQTARVVCSGKPQAFVYQFDPTDPTERAAAHDFLCKEIGVDLQFEPKTIASSPPSTAPGKDGVLYHPPIAVTLLFSFGTSHDSATHFVPNTAVTECLSLRRASLVKQDTQITFSSGMPNHVKFTRGSQALAAVQIPQKIAAKAAEVVPQIIKVQNSAATDELRAKTELLQAQQSYLQAQMDLRRKEAELKAMKDKNGEQKPADAEN